MRSRTIREGSVGLVILLGLAVAGGLFLWLRGFTPGNRSYRATVRFPNVDGMQIGAPVRYRGVAVGKISDIRVSANYAEVEVRIQPATTIIPKNITIEAQQSGLVGETFINMTPNAQLSSEVANQQPLAPNCNEDLIVCNGSYLQGTTSVTMTELLGSVIRFTNLFSSPEFFGNVQTLTKNFASAAEGVDVLAGEVTTLSKSVRGELGTLSTSAQRSADSIGIAATQFGLTANELTTLVSENRSSLVTTLDNLNQTVLGVRSIVSTLSPVIKDGDFLRNLELLSANAAEASANLRNLSVAVGTSDNILLLQQTLDSARATFQNAQKITADLDELTGDPTFRQNILQLVNGLSSLVSYTQELQEQTQLAQELMPATVALEAEANSAEQISTVKPQQPSQVSIENQDKKPNENSSENQSGNPSKNQPQAEPTGAAALRSNRVEATSLNSSNSSKKDAQLQSEYDATAEQVEPARTNIPSWADSARDSQLPNAGLQDP